MSNQVYVRTVTKRNGKESPVSFDKITRRIRSLSYDLTVEPEFVMQETIRSMTDKMKTSQIDELSASCAAFMVRMHVDYLQLAGRIIVSNLHKETSSCFSDCMEIVNAQSLDRSSCANFLSPDFMAAVRKHSKVLDAAIRHDADYEFDYFGIQTLTNSYLNRVGGVVVERPQYMFMRVALFLHMDDIFMALKTYQMFSQKLYTHASPTLFNAGKPEAQCSSCYLCQVPEDSLSSIYDTLKQCAMISKHAGGIGLAVHRVRSAKSIIKSSGGQGDGLVPMLRVFNNTARYVNQGGKRKGAFAIYLEPWHADIESFILLKKNRGNEDERARDLHYAMWIPDLFMRRVEKDESWTLFSPDTAPGLSDVYGEEFDRLYVQYESQSIGRATVPARKIWEQIIESQIETGEPYILYKDACNIKSNQKNLGTIHSSNLCVSGATPLLTPYGYFPIKELLGQEIDVWNGQQWSSVVVKRTSEQASLVRVKFSDGSYIECTDYHKFYLQTNPTEPDHPTEPVEAHQLRPGDQLINFKGPDVTDFRCENVYQFESSVLGITSPVPINAKPATKVEWLTTLINQCGFSDAKGLHILADAQVLTSTRLLLHTLGVYSSLSSLTNLTQLSILGSRDVTKLLDMGLKVTKFKLVPIQALPDDRCVSVVDIVSLDRQEPTYCFTEPLRSMGVFNGILTGNCAEILEYTSKDEVAVCNLCSICLPSFVSAKNFDHQKLYDVVYMATHNLNRVIDLNFYPIPEAKNSNLKHRPIGIGVQGLADVYCMMMYPYDSPEAAQVNKDIFETIYFAATTASKDLAKLHGSYASFKGSPASEGVLQFDLWKVTPSKRWDWGSLKEEIRKYGLRNSLLVALMPTASTSQIMGNNESCEPYTRNIYVRRTDAGEFIVVNHHLARILSEMSLWTPDIIDKMIARDGSIQSIDGIPDHVKKVFKTAFEVKSRPVIDQSADRGPFVCQTQSMNLWIETPTPQLLNTVHFYAWSRGLKTGMYYLRSKPVTLAQKFAVDPTTVSDAQTSQSAAPQPPQTAQPPTAESPTQAAPPQPPQAPGKTYSKNGKIYVCTETECVSCGS